MNPLARFLAALVDSLPQPIGAESDGVRLVADSVDLLVPIESHIGQHGELRVSLPRGRMSTGFELPLGRIRAQFVLEARTRGPSARSAS